MKKTIRDLDLDGKRILVRVDYNVPILNGNVVDPARILETLPTIQYLLEHQARVVLMSHLGRPRGKVVEELRLTPVAKELERLLGAEGISSVVRKVDDCKGEKVREAARALKPGEILLLENLRFYPEEEKNDPDFARELASLGEVYVNDAFGAAHRAHASTHGVAGYLPAVAGLLMEKELKILGSLLENPRRPFMVLLGGAKVSDKIGVIKSLLRKADVLMIGGAMAFTFIKAQGGEVGRSLVEDDKLDVARGILEEAEALDKKLLLPLDVLAVEKPEAGMPIQKVSAREIPSHLMGVDIGRETLDEYQVQLAKANTIFWNGPMGIFEIPAYAEGTNNIARTLHMGLAVTVVGGGDSLLALKNLGLTHTVTHCSTGGGASLEFLEGKDLPGVAVLQDAQPSPQLQT